MVADLSRLLGAAWRCALGFRERLEEESCQLPEQEYPVC